MPFSEFRFLNGSTGPADSTVIVDGAPVQIQNVPPKQEQIQQLPPPPPPPGNQIDQAEVHAGGRVFQLQNAPLLSPDPSGFQTVATVVSDGNNGQTLCVVIGTTMNGAQICAELV